MSVTTIAAGTAFYIGLAAGIALGGIGGGLVWKLQGAKVDKLRAENMSLTTAAASAEAEARTVRRESQTTIDQLAKDRDAAIRKRQETYVESLKLLDKIDQLELSATTVAIPRRAVSVLNNSRRASQTAAHQDPGPVPGSAPGAPADTDRSGGTSQRAMTKWVAFALKTDAELRDMHAFLADSIRAAPQCFEIVEDRWLTR